MRHVLDTGAEVCTAGDASCLMHIGGGLSRLRRRRPHRPPGRDPRLHGGAVARRASTAGGERGAATGLPRACRPRPRGVGHLRGDEPFPDAAREALATPQLRRNLGHATATIRDKRARGGRRAARLGGAARRRRRRSRTTTWPTCRTCSSSSRSRSPRAAASCTGPRDADEANRIVTELVRATGADRGRQGQVDGHPGDRAQRGAGGGRASRPVETDLAELIVQLGARPAVSHILVPAIHRNRAEIREIFLREMPGVGPAT